LPQIKDGDVIGADSQNDTYRNTANAFWDTATAFWDAQTQRVINFGDDLDEYGCAPSHFSFPRFLLHYFESVLTHNNFVRLEKRFLEQIRNHARYGQVPEELQTLCTEKIPNVVWSFFIHGKTKHYVLGIPVDVEYVSQEITYQNEYGESHTTGGDLTKHKVGSIDYVANFMRLFMDNACAERICFTSDEQDYGCDSQDVLFVMC
jgi:hypothetical protein